MHRSHVPPKSWYRALYIMTSHSDGMSALQLQHHLGMGSYKSALMLVHKIRRAMRAAEGSPLVAMHRLVANLRQGRRRERNIIVEIQKIWFCVFCLSVGAGGMNLSFRISDPTAEGGRESAPRPSRPAASHCAGRIRGEPLGPRPCTGFRVPAPKAARNRRTPVDPTEFLSRKPVFNENQHVVTADLKQ